MVVVIVLAVVLLVGAIMLFVHFRSAQEAPAGRVGAALRTAP
jgi:hypothetical protein